MCAIESAARHNPNTKIIIYTLRASLSKKASNLLGNFSNIRIKMFKPEEELDNVTTSRRLSSTWFWKKGKLQKSQYSHAHLSDFLRLVLIWKYGGIYLDLDMITLKSYQPLFEIKKNGFGYMYENYDNINNAFLIFNRINHPFLRAVIDAFVREYDENDWAKNGPVLIKKTILNYCKISNYLDLDLYGFKPAAFSNSLLHPCLDLTLYPESYFYPLTYVRNEHRAIFEPNSSRLNQSLYLKMKNSYSLHLFNQLSSIFSASK